MGRSEVNHENLVFFRSALTNLGHANIIKYTGRTQYMNPDELRIFKEIKAGSQVITKNDRLKISQETLQRMNIDIIRGWNGRVKPGDIVYDGGDFCFRGGREGGKTKAQFWEEQLNGKIIHFRGNHDYNNGVKGLDLAIIRFGGLTVLLTHIPPTNVSLNTFGERVFFKNPICNLVLSGHVHGKWKHSYCQGIPIINVGVDVWNFRPVSVQEILVYYDRIKK